MAEAASKKVLDFTNVKDGGAYQTPRVPAGDYKAKILNVADGESKAGNDQWVFGIQLEGKRAVYPYYCQLSEKSLWKIRNLLIAAGLAVPKKRVGVDPNKVVGKTIGVSMEDDEYEGKAKSVIVAVFPADEVTDSPAADSSSSSDDEDGEVDEDEMEEMDVEDL